MRANRLKELREKKGISQGELERQIGLSQSSVSKYEKETREIGIDLAISFADYFGVSLDYFFKRESPHRYEVVFRTDDDEATCMEVDARDEWNEIKKLLNNSGYATKLYKR